jgi:hypothetical protein
VIAISLHTGASFSIAAGRISPHLNCRFVLALAQIDNMSEPTARRPFDSWPRRSFRAVPNGLGKHHRRSEPAPSWWRGMSESRTPG